METSRFLLLTLVSISIAITLIASGAGLAGRRDRSWLMRGVAVVGWLLGAYLLYRVGQVWRLA